MKRSLCVAGLILAAPGAATGCGDGADGGFAAAWMRDGQSASAYQLQVFRGSGHCGWESVDFLHVGWPPGSSIRVADAGRQYVRDPDSVLGGHVDRPLLDVELPDDAVASGFASEGGISLWFADSAPELAYRVSPEV